MPSHFHSARIASDRASGNPRSSSGCASIGGRNGAGFRFSGRWPRPRPRRTGSRRAARARARPARPSSGSMPAEARDRGLGEPRRDADAQLAGDRASAAPSARSRRARRASRRGAPAARACGVVEQGLDRPRTRVGAAIVALSPCGEGRVADRGRALARVRPRAHRYLPAGGDGVSAAGHISATVSARSPT